jgi:predicted PurR-regulated permease PerM
MTQKMGFVLTRAAMTDNLGWSCNDCLGTGTKEGQVRITIPRWAQLVLIPVAIFFAVYFCRAASHAVFIFVMATLVALLLNPLVMLLGRIKLPRWLAVPLVYLVFLAVVVLVLVFLGPLLVVQLQRLFGAIPGWLDSFNDTLIGLQNWLGQHGVDVNLHMDTTDIVHWLQ